MISIQDTHEFIRNVLCMDVIQGYGLTETTAGATLMVQEDITIGRSGPPVSTSLIRLVNWEEGNYLVTKKPYPQGEVVVGGDNVTLGYFKRPELNDETFFVENGLRWMRTGDIAEVYEDGCFKIIGESFYSYFEDNLHKFLKSLENCWKL